MCGSTSSRIFTSKLVKSVGVGVAFTAPPAPYPYTKKIPQFEEKKHILNH